MADCESHLMSQAVCELLVNRLINSEELSEISETIQVGLESGQGIWQFLMDNPIAFGMLVGAGSMSLLRQWVHKKARKYNTHAT